MMGQGQGQGQVLFDLYGFEFTGFQMTSIGPPLPHPCLSSLSPHSSHRWSVVCSWHCTFGGYNFLL